MFLKSQRRTAARFNPDTDEYENPDHHDTEGLATGNPWGELQPRSLGTQHQHHHGPRPGQELLRQTSPGTRIADPALPSGRWRLWLLLGASAGLAAGLSFAADAGEPFWQAPRDLNVVAQDAQRANHVV